MSKDVGHVFELYNYMSPTYCDYCGEILLGVLRQGLQCKKCLYNTHQKCKNRITDECVRKVGKLNGSHNFIEKTYHRPTFCRFCKGLLVGLIKQGLQCTECGLNVHKRCETKCNQTCFSTNSLDEKHKEQDLLATTTVEQAKVVDLQQRRNPSKHFVFIMTVEWSNGYNCTVARRYSQFHSMHKRLVEEFPEESGMYDPYARKLPFLPGKQMFGSQDSSVAVKRLPSIKLYCTKLSTLSDRIKQSDIITKFFTPKDEDKKSFLMVNGKSQIDMLSNIDGALTCERYTAVANYQAQAKTQVDLEAGENYDVMQKNETGWSLIVTEEGKFGWVPSELMVKIHDPKQATNYAHEVNEGREEQVFVALHDFTSVTERELSFKRNDRLRIKKKFLDGWWLATLNGRESWVPESYLASSLQKERPSSSTAHNQKQPHQGTGLHLPRPCSTSDPVISRKFPSPNNQGNRAKRFINTKTYKVKDGGRVSQNRQQLKVFDEESEDGWTLVSTARKSSGYWIPADLESFAESQETNEPPETEDCYLTMSDLC